jgi:hypothetical protein
MGLYVLCCTVISWTRQCVITYCGKYGKFPPWIGRGSVQSLYFLLFLFSFLCSYTWRTISGFNSLSEPELTRRSATNTIVNNGSLQRCHFLLHYKDCRGKWPLFVAPQAWSWERALVRLDSDLSMSQGCARQMGLSLQRLGDSGCIRSNWPWSVRVPSHIGYFYTSAGVEQACVEVQLLMGLLISEEMWCICGMMLYSLNRR